MFKRSLQEKLSRIFDLDKVTFDIPGESQEQEGVFVAVQSAKTRLKDGVETAEVRGTLHVFGVSEKLPYGYFSKCLQEADQADTKDLFFHGFEEHKGTYRNIVERSLDFVYLYSGQYDPALGTITEIDLSLQETL